MTENTFPAERTYQQAKRFKVASEILLKHVNDVFEYDGSVINVSVPMMVNLAFSCELFLKCIIHIETGFQITGHNISSIFHQLSEKPREFILNKLYSAQVFERVSLDADLDSISYIFVRLRYLNEGIKSGKVAGHFLKYLVSASEEYIIKKFPEWEVNYYSNFKRD